MSGGQAPPPVPPSYGVATFATDGSDFAQIAARQLTLEAASAPGVDQARSWSIWLNPHNVRPSSMMTQAQRVFAVANTADGFQQYSLAIQSYSTATLNQLFSFLIFDTANTSFIGIDSPFRAVRSTWQHVVITYDGSETAAGLKMYVNGVLQSTATRTAGAYAGAGNSANYRFQLSAVPTGSRYTGRMKDLGLWNQALSQTEVNEIYNLGVPIDLSTTSIYATKIVGYWKLATDLVNTANGAMNFSVAGTNPGFASLPISPTFYNIGIFNAVPGNTKYMSFGSMFNNGATLVWYGRSGDDHLLNGVIQKVTFNPVIPRVAGTPVTVLTDAGYDLRGAGGSGVIDNLISLFTARWDEGGGFIQDCDRYDSTDGLTGETFGSRVQFGSSLDNANFYGKVVPGYNAGEYHVCQYLESGGTYFIYIWNRTSGGVWSSQVVYSSAANLFVEPALLRAGNNVFLIICRRDSGGGLYLISSVDGGATWSVPTSTALGAGGQAMADMCLTPTGKVSLIYADRSNGGIYVSLANPLSDLLADPTDWITPSQIFQNYSFGGNSILGYPCIVADGYYCAVAFSAEFSASRADLFFGYGIQEA